jgi:hypothetical protein
LPSDDADGASGHREADMRKTIAGTAVAAAVAVALVLPATSASADGIEREKRGSCDPKGRWELSLDKENGRIEMDYEVTSKPAGQRWKVVIRHDGTKIFDGVKVTQKDDDDLPDLEVERTVNDTSGSDTFKARARNTATGAVCRGSLSI